MADYWTNCYDNLRTGWNPEEVILTPDEIIKSFSLLFTYTVTGRVFAQPLMVSNVVAYKDGDTTNPPQTLNVVFVATADNWIYAFDAKQNVPIWSRQLLPANERLINPRRHKQLAALHTRVRQLGVLSPRSMAGSGRNRRPSPAERP